MGKASILLIKRRSLSVRASVRQSPETQVLRARSCYRGFGTSTYCSSFFFFFFSALNCRRRRTGFFFFSSSSSSSFRPKLPSSTDRVFFFSHPKLPSSTDVVFFLPLCPFEIVCHYMIHITSIRCGLFYVSQWGRFSHIYQLLDF